MLVKEEIDINLIKSRDFIPEDTLFFDIETTGLSARTSHITVIGTACRKNDTLFFCQYFVEDPRREADILSDFCAYASGFKAAAHFNGATFDIPYVTAKCSFYGLPDPFSGLKSFDLYRFCRGLKNLLTLDSMKQKSIETLFSFKRKDTLSGADCITAYTHFLRYNDKESADAILLHNKEDVLGLMLLTALSAFESFKCGGYTVKSVSADESGLVIKTELNSPLLFRIKSQRGPYTLDAYGLDAVFKTAGVHTTLYYYFKNYKDYYYIPEEDMAVHKSVGKYYAPETAVKATAATAYTKISDFFIYQPCDIINPVFRPDRHSKLALFQAKKAPGTKDAAWMQYTKSIIELMLKKQSGGK